jgi:putative (di)nucleoside polyphosphate hydrolase
MKRPTKYFRAGVGAVLTDQHGRVLIFERADVPGAWQFPQGGLENEEQPIDAVLREIREETGISRRGLVILDRYPGLLAYELPLRARSVKTGMGQAQYWFLFKVKKAAATDVRLPAHSEFRAAEWVLFGEAVKRVVGFKRPLYRQLQKEFANAVTKLSREARRVARSRRQS